MGSSSNFIAILAICFLVLQPIYAAPSDFLSPLLDRICKQVECGKGTCKVSTNDTLGYICECQSGWKHTRGDVDDEDFKFLPCVIPNCSLDYSCANAPPPAPEFKEPPMNTSFYDPCYYAYCGEGSCKKSMENGYTCECNDGYKNVLNNITASPCYSQCVLGSDCRKLGIASNDSATSSPNRDAKNYASSTLPGSYFWFSTLIISLGLVLRS